MYDMKKVIMMILPALFLAGCTVKEKEAEITVFRNTAASVYTGKVKRKIPNGEGMALMENNARVEGLFEKGTLISGKADNVPYSITYYDQMISGSYTGDVSDQLPSGTGAFGSDTYTYSGTWTDGMPDGTGTLSADYFCISTPAEDLEGSYSGEVIKGLAEGKGTFVYQSGNDEIQMEGSFAENMFDGMMVKTIRYQNTVKSYPVYYRKGKPLHTTASMIAYLEGMRSESYRLNDAQLSFIADHSALFEGSSSEKDISAASAHAFDYKAFSEDSEPALIMIRNAAIRSVQRYIPYAGSDTVTSMIVQNSDGWYHIVFSYAVTRADQGDIVDILALPLCRSTLTAPEQDYQAIDAAGALMIGG